MPRLSLLTSLGNGKCRPHHGTSCFVIELLLEGFALPHTMLTATKRCTTLLDCHGKHRSGVVLCSEGGLVCWLATFASAGTVRGATHRRWSSADQKGRGPFTAGAGETDSRLRPKEESWLRICLTAAFCFR